MTLKRILTYAAAAGLAAALFYFYGGHQVPSGQPPLATIDAATFPQLKQAFNAHSASEVRLILMFSPT